MKLSQIVKHADLPQARNFLAVDFTVDGKTVVKYTEDYTISKDEQGNEVATPKADAVYYLEKDTVQLVVPMPVITALKWDKSLNSRRWLTTDLKDLILEVEDTIITTKVRDGKEVEVKEKGMVAYNALELLGIGRSKGVLASLDMTVETLKVKVLNKVKAGKLNSTKTKGLKFIPADVDMFTDKINKFSDEINLAFINLIAGTVNDIEDEVNELY